MAPAYGAARTGVAVRDPTGTLARPLGVVQRVGAEAGLTELCAIIAREQPDLILVGLPLTLRGERGPQAVEPDAFVERLRTRCHTPIRTEDERFTTTIARRTPSPGRRRPQEDDHLAAAVLLQGYLDRAAHRHPDEEA